MRSILGKIKLLSRRREHEPTTQQTMGPSSMAPTATQTESTIQEAEPTTTPTEVITEITTDTGLSPEEAGQAATSTEVTTERTHRASLSPEPTLPTLQTRLWNAAYDSIKEADPKLIDTYERILSSKLAELDLEADPEDAGGNSIGQDGEKRSAQMQALAKHGLKQTEKAASVADKTTQALQVITTVKGVVSSALQSVPQAAVAWAGVCLGLEVNQIAASHYLFP